jgi:hypothetical protein
MPEADIDASPYRALQGHGGAGAVRCADSRPPVAWPKSRSRAPRTVGSQSGLEARDVVFALGVLLSSASQLRPGGSSIGPGELCLVLWLLLMLGREAARLGPPLTPALSRLLVFWLLFATAESLGTMTAFVIRDKHDPVWFMHDVVAYPLLAALSCMIVVEPGAGQRARRVAWLLVTIGAGCLVLQLAGGWGLIGIPRSDPWYWDRFRGWSANPAQLALLCAALGLMALHLAETAARPRERIAAIGCMILPIYVGLLTKTDTFTLVVVAAGPIFVALKFRTWLLSSGRRLTFRSAAAWTIVLALPLLLVSVAPLASAITDQTASLAKAMSKDNGKTSKEEADLRLHLWGEAWSRGIESGMLGLGPGPHLPIPASIVAARKTEGPQPANLQHPSANGTPNFEAHDTVLDLFTQGGLLAVASLFWLVGTALFNTYKAGLAGLTTLLCGLLLFSVFDLIARYPIFWFAIALCLVSGLEARAAATAQKRS